MPVPGSVVLVRGLCVGPVRLCVVVCCCCVLLLLCVVVGCGQLPGVVGGGQYC